MKLGSISDRPAITADRDRVAAAVIRAIDQEPTHTAVAHLAEADLGRAVGDDPNHSADQATSEAATSCCALNRPVRSVRLSGAMLTA